MLVPKNVGSKRILVYELKIGIKFSIKILRSHVLTFDISDNKRVRNCFIVSSFFTFLAGVPLYILGGYFAPHRVSCIVSRGKTSTQEPDILLQD